ncbi:Z1 domain-containing protein [Xenorhabdus bovienii]|uniref:Z1 domain-containing protein n=1 Tax=Xenorhabdus bovienii TaxID=40576 RepID=UPI0023B2FFEA|nr:Z1 domain-containing protein [Xenorhabdus bovienii]MDE9457923.1 Z1 domain-containing protein [Xenorhabdus bovienii]MDE9486196.1 Z1 domain-containing protein [Xenorhabdus bovienii]MDE9513989.1 Z1 domain-containing protein [Xenorhabdus bovienii]
MNNTKSVMSAVESILFLQSKKTEEELRKLIQDIASVIAPELDKKTIEQIAREIETKQGIKAGLGAFIDTEDFEPWLDNAKSHIEPFYWNRYRQLLLQNGLPKDVVIATDTVTDKILSRLGDPNKQTSWDRRGMVVGHVQSGKTANYIGLICKAADAGYRLIIVIAGIHSNLRNQTQARIDEGFIGRDTGKSQKKKGGEANNRIGVGQFNYNRTPVSLTNTLKDFNKATASTNTSEIDSYKVPVVLVIKKNHRTLTNLLEWLKDNSARGDREMIYQPMLLIDDEADNASINTKYEKKLITTINRQIRDLLNMFHRSCYIGYTATPFANIFIDPDQENEMYNEDLFPRDFIIGLDSPSNYFGPRKIFVEGLLNEDESTWLRNITDNEDVLPIIHKIDRKIDTLPNSLINALRTFLISRAIRNLRGQTKSHCSMLVNASRFTTVQGEIRNRLHEVLERIQNAVRINASREADALKDPELAELYSVWKQEYSGAEPDWFNIQSVLLDAIASAKVVEVNSRINDLDYTSSSERGQTVIAVGGFSLSRGLTLEGLTVTWFLRNTKMYDTLMQMGRWFGYRNNYEDLCRIWMPPEGISWYSFIAEATEELHNELHTLEQVKATPKMFGLAVRKHPATLLVTARNKMGSGRPITMQVGLSKKFIETSRVSANPEDLRMNKELAKRLIQQLSIGDFEETKPSAGTCVMHVPFGGIVEQFLSGWRNTEQSITTDPRLVQKYIRAKKSDHGELEFWDILISSKQSGEVNHELGREIIPIRRSVEPSDLLNNFISFNGQRMRVADASFEKAGLSEDEISIAEAGYNVNGKQKNYPGHIYRSVRKRPLLIIMLVETFPMKGKEQKLGAESIPLEPIVAWGISFPESKRPNETIEYIVNTVRYQEIFGAEDEDDDQEEELCEQ